MSVALNTEVRRNTRGGEITYISLPDGNSFWMHVCFCPFSKQQMTKFPLGKWFGSFQLMSWLNAFWNHIWKGSFPTLLPISLGSKSASLCSHNLTPYSSNRAPSKHNRFPFQLFFKCREVKYKKWTEKPQFTVRLYLLIHKADGSTCKSFVVLDIPPSFRWEFGSSGITCLKNYDTERQENKRNTGIPAVDESK